MSNRPRALAVLIAVFLLGGIVGSAGSYFWFGNLRSTPVERARNGPPQMPERKTLPELLNLTPDQVTRFREIMSEARQKLGALRIEHEELSQEQAPKIEQIWADTNRKFSAILNEEQKEKFEAFLKEMETMRKRPPRGRGFEPGDRGNSRPPR